MGHQNSARLAVLATLALGITTLGAAPALAAAPEPVTPLKVSATKLTKLPVPVSNPIPLRQGQRASWFVQFEGKGAAAAARQQGGGTSGTTAARARTAQVKGLSAGALSRARQADSGAASLFTVSNAMAGVGLRLDAAGAAAVAQAPGVAKVSRIIPKTLQNSNTAQLVKAVNTWRSSGNTGKGVSVGVIDTGLDYTHADFGGKGTVAAYDAAKASSTSPTWLQGLPKRAKVKIVGGYDFVGDAYDSGAAAGNPATIPQPDNNPLDCNGHGTHVAGTAVGYGVTASGKTFKPKKLTGLTKKKLDAMRIGPGMAPQASLFALKVFGCEGSTDAVLPALDRALDPNSDGKFDDKLDIVNMSLGSDYGPVDDPENDMLDAITANGVLSVVSNGNAGDLVDVNGSPGNATSTLAVASSVDSYQLRDALKVNAPAAVAGNVGGQASIAYDWKAKPPVTGTVVAPSDADGCAPLSAADAALVRGKVAWLTWDDNDQTRVCGSVARSKNVKDAGAIGAVFTGGVDPFGAGISGDADIPVFQLTPASTQKLAPQVATGQLNVTFSGALLRTLPDYDKGLTDTISTFTSRGTHGSLGVVKPDVAAVGDTVASAGFGSGNQALVESGTSMAAPTTAGVAALVKAAHPKWSPLKVKAAIMNTARHDLYTGKGKTGLRYGPNRVGAGRIDAEAAVQTKLLAYVNGAANPVSASFGVVPAPINGGTVTRTRELVIRNLGAKAQKVKISYEGIVTSPGVSYSVSKSTVKIKAKRKAKVTVTMTVTPTALRHTIDPTQQARQLDTPRQYLSDASGRLLVKPQGKAASRVPVYGAAKPTSATTTSVQPNGSALVTNGAGIRTGGTTTTDYTSLLSVLELGAASPQLPTCTVADYKDGCVLTPTDRSMDLQYVGAGATQGLTACCTSGSRPTPTGP